MSTRRPRHVDPPRASMGAEMTMLWPSSTPTASPSNGFERAQATELAGEPDWACRDQDSTRSRSVVAD